jgi:hypothetical protein
LIHIQASLVLLPVLLPTVILLVTIRLSISSHYSRSRIKLLESEDTSATQRLIHIFGQLERGVEDIVVDIVDSPTSPVLSKESLRISMQSSRITPGQRRMVVALNVVPQLKKELAYISDVRNSHTVIIACDIKYFKSHKIGESVLRHWADAFVI